MLWRSVATWSAPSLLRNPVGDGSGIPRNCFASGRSFQIQAASSIAGTCFRCDWLFAACVVSCLSPYAGDVEFLPNKVCRAGQEVTAIGKKEPKVLGYRANMA